MKLENSLVVLDLETTGTWVEKDKIIEIALIKYDPDGKKEIYHKMVNPGIPIPQAVTDLTGIDESKVKDAPAFREISKEVMEFIGYSDLAGFNVERFDLPLLEREFGELGVSFKWRQHQVYDAQKVFHINEKRDLSAAYKFYCENDLVNAHSALADTEATYAVLCKQVEKYGEGSDKLETLNRFQYVSNMRFFDSDKKMAWWNDRLYFMFGKYAKKKSLEEIAETDKNYLNWVLDKDFNSEVKRVVRDALNGKYPSVKTT